MPRQRPLTPPPVEVKVFSSREEIDRGITTLRRRVDDVKRLKTDGVRFGDAKIKDTREKIREAVLEVFGHNSPQYKANEHLDIYKGPMAMGMEDYEWQAGFEAGIPHTVSILDGLIAGLEEKREDFEADPGAPARAALESGDLHPQITAAAMPTFRDGHYREAVVNATIALGDLVKAKSGRADLDGVTLMQQAFSRNGPILAFNDLTDRADLDEQEGMMHLFEGAIMALRNPRAHALDPDKPDDARDILTFLSYLAKCLDKAKKVK